VERRYGRAKIGSMTPENEPRRTTDLLLLFIWVLGYFFLIRVFAALQRLEGVLVGPR
jgi:hypothetical protein